MNTQNKSVTGASAVSLFNHGGAIFSQPLTTGAGLGLGWNASRRAEWFASGQCGVPPWVVVVTVGQSDLPSVLFATGGTGAGGMGDITGNNKAGAGKGAGVSGTMSATLFAVTRGKRGAVRRRIVGKRSAKIGQRIEERGHTVGSPLHGSQDDSFACVVGLDSPLFESKQEFLRWAMGQDKVEPSLADGLLAIGKRAAAKQARQLEQRRGIAPSETSIEDAAADAVACVLQAVTFLPSCTLSDLADNESLRRSLAMLAGRGAFLSFVNWSSLGMTGDNTKKSKAFVQELTAELADKLADTKSFSEIDGAARAAVARWVFRVGLLQFKRNLPNGGKGAGNAAAIRAARSRCRVVGEVVMGASLTAAADLHFSGGVKNFSESCKDSGFWSLLETASKTRRAGSFADYARGMMRANAIDARDTFADLRALGRAPKAALRPVNTGTVRAGSAQGQAAIGWTLRRRQLLAEFNQSVRESVMWRDAAARSLKRDALAFAFVRHCVGNSRFDASLREVFSLDKAKRGQAGKLNPQLIGKARGTVSRRQPDTLTVSLAVGRYGAELPCARLAPANIKPLVLGF